MPKRTATPVNDQIQELERQLAETRAALRAAQSPPAPPETARRYELLASSIPDILLFIDPSSGRILEANQRAVQAYGYSHPELLQRTIFDLRIPEQRNLAAVQLAAAGSGGVVFEAVHQRADGSTFPVEVSSSASGSGSEKILLSIVRDISRRKQAEAALLSSEALYRSIVKSIPKSAVWVVDHDLRFLLVEGDLSSTLGLDPQNMEGCTVSECLDPTFAASVEPHYRGALAGQASAYETEYAGSFLVTEFTPLADPEGRIFAALAVTVDLTERKREEERLRESEERLRLAYEVAGLGTWDWQPGQTYSINNDIYFKIHGLEPHPEGKVEFGPYLARVHPEDRDRLRLTVNRASTGELVVDLPFRFLRPDGELRWMQSYRRNFFESGRLVRQIGAVRDITQQVRYEEELQAANQALTSATESLQQTLRELQSGEERFRLLVDSMEDYVFTLDTHQRHTGLFGRALARFAIQPSQFIGRTAAELLGEEAAQVHIQANQRALSGEDVVYEWSQPGPAGLAYFQTRLSPLHSSQGEIVGLVGVGREITDRKQAERELDAYALRLEQSNRELQEFAYVASHDLQEPLRKIRFFADQLALLPLDQIDPSGRDFLARMRASVERLQRMIADLLELSRVSTQGQPFTSTDLRQAAVEAVSDLEIAIQTSGALVTLADLPVIEADPHQMRRLFQNLIGNALKYRRDGVPPQVSVRSEEIPTNQPSGAWVRIVVEDNGIGFHLHFLERIFQPFQRLHGRGKYEGTGMGLAICKKIVERHGGTITAESTPGLGSAFIVDLPARTHQPQRGPAG